MAKRPTSRSAFWTGALCGAVAACVAERLLQHTWPSFALLHNKKRPSADVYRIPLRRDAAGGDPSWLEPDRSRTHPEFDHGFESRFERSGGAPGGVAAPEVHERPGHPEEKLDYSDPAQRVRSSSRTLFHPPADFQN